MSNTPQREARAGDKAWITSQSVLPVEFHWTECEVLSNPIEALVSTPNGVEWKRHNLVRLRNGWEVDPNYPHIKLAVLTPCLIPIRPDDEQEFETQYQLELREKKRLEEKAHRYQPTENN